MILQTIHVLQQSLWNELNSPLIAILKPQAKVLFCKKWRLLAWMQRHSFIGHTRSLHTQTHLLHTQGKAHIHYTAMGDDLADKLTSIHVPIKHSCPKTDPLRMNQIQFWQNDYSQPEPVHTFYGEHLDNRAIGAWLTHTQADLHTWNKYICMLHMHRHTACSIQHIVRQTVYPETNS